MLTGHSGTDIRNQSMKQGVNIVTCCLKAGKAGISEAALFTRQRTRRAVTTQRTSATQLGGSFSVATELVGKVSSIPAAKTLLNIER
jgi:hypothetical protein